MLHDPFPSVKDVVLKERIALSAMHGIMSGARSVKECKVGFDVFKDCVLTSEGRGGFVLHVARSFSLFTSRSSKKQAIALLQACEAAGWYATTTLVRKMKLHDAYRDAWEGLIGGEGDPRRWSDEIAHNEKEGVLWKTYMPLFLQLVPPPHGLKRPLKKILAKLNFSLFDVLQESVPTTALPSFSTEELVTYLTKGLVDELPAFSTRSRSYDSTGEKLCHMARRLTPHLPGSFFQDLWKHIERHKDLFLYDDDLKGKMREILEAAGRVHTSTLLKEALPENSRNMPQKRRCRL